ncbi:N-acetylmuramoyl-L-alanine amidase [Octadecabacter sp. R77987]|uniref:N-acetylmuramoyl-L-alanine amidase n=1 Tax=Octadecabacter sp. R77987 TaxID=3093874 RepID=UPI003670B224
MQARLLSRMIGPVLAIALAFPAVAQEFSGLARLDVAQSQVRDTWGGVELELFLSQPVPYRVFTLDDPRRLVLDFREVDWRGATRAALLNADRVSDLRFGALRPGWSRMVLDLGEPLRVRAAGMAVDATDGTAHITVTLEGTDADSFTATAGAPNDPDWEFLMAADPTSAAAPPQDDGILTIVIDPGHGGIDPGAERDGLQEADLMLQLGREVAEALTRAGDINVVLTRDSDTFVPLEERITIARAARADAFISLHADALEADDATGASIYTLTDAAEGEASQRMAERHDRADLLAGLDLSGQDDTVATVLMDLARIETAPKGERLAQALVAGLGDTGATLNSRPRREAVLAVLNAADFPSVLVEVGFLSNDRDRAALVTPEGRANLVAGIVLAVQRWATAEAALDPLVRQ